MFQGIRELQAAKGRTLLITITVGMITVMVTFLSALASGLSHESVSALQHRVTGDSSLVISDSGSTAWNASQLTDDQVAATGGEAVKIARDRVGSDPVVFITDPSVPNGHASAPTDIAHANPSLTVGSQELKVDEDKENLSLDHLPAVFISPEDATQLARPSVAAIVPAGEHPDVPGTQVLEGKKRWEASSSYAGEQMSLNLMINLLYVISALVLGAFFMVWTIQRLRGVAISSALGAARKVLAADSLGQALIVLAVGVVGGLAVTVGSVALIGDALPAVVDASTTAKPALILILSGLLGAALSLRPVMKVSPRAAMAAA